MRASSQKLPDLIGDLLNGHQSIDGGRVARRLVQVATKNCIRTGLPTIHRYTKIDQLVVSLNLVLPLPQQITFTRLQMQLASHHKLSCLCRLVSFICKQAKRTISQSEMVRFLAGHHKFKQTFAQKQSTCENSVSTLVVVVVVV